MAGEIRVQVRRRGIQQIMTSPKMRAEIERRAAAVAAACNAQSSWGGYESGAESLNRIRASANVWTTDLRATRDEARSNRMIHNLGSAR